MSALYDATSRDRCIALYRRCVAEHEAGRLHMCGWPTCIAGNATGMWPGEITMNDGEPRSTSGYGYDALAEVLGVSSREVFKFCHSGLAPDEAITRFRAFIDRHWPGALEAQS